MTRDELLFAQAFDLIQQAKRILIVADTHIDGDSLGSSSAMISWLKREKKEVQAFCERPIPRHFLYMESAHYFSQNESLFDQPFDMVITFDTGSLKRCGIELLLPRIPQTFALLNIDHHETNLRFGTLNVVFPQASSTAEVVYRFFDANRITIDVAMATALLSGLWTDTTAFTNSATTIKSLEAASTLLAAGARFSDLQKNIIRLQTAPALAMLGIALSRLHLHPRYHVLSTYFFKNDVSSIHESDEYMEWIVNYIAGSCADTDILLVLRESINGMVKGSFRSMNHDVSRVAALMGGGGHKRAAGFAIPGYLCLKNGIIGIQKDEQIA